MIELRITSEDIAKAEAGIKDWCNPDGTLNVQKMQADIKKELIKGQQNQQPMRRPTTKALFTKYNQKKKSSPPIETKRLNPTVERIKQVQL